LLRSVTKDRVFFFDFSEANTSLQAAVAPEVEMGGWKSVKKERVTFLDKASEKVQKKKEPETEKVFSKKFSVPFHDQKVACPSISCRYDAYSYKRCTQQ